MANRANGGEEVPSGDELLRRYKLIRSSREGVPVECDGVTIDLRSELDSAVWQPILPLGMYGHFAALHGPGIIFPWTDEGWRKHFRDRGSVVEAKAGSRVSVRAISTIPIETQFAEFDHPSQRERKLAFLIVTSEEGSIELVERPLIFLKSGMVSHFIGIGDYYGAYHGMLARLEQVLGVSDIEEMAEGPPEDWVKLPDGLPQSFGLAFISLASRQDDFDGHAMAAFGYMMARAEAEEQLLGFAKRGAKAAKSAHLASSAKSAKDREAAEVVRNLARNRIQNDTSISLTRCARLVAADLDKDQRWVYRTIKELFVPRKGGREYKPRDGI